MTQPRQPAFWLDSKRTSGLQRQSHGLLLLCVRDDLATALNRSISRMDWELSKENFQPLKRGRGPEKLQDAEPSPSASKAALDETRR